MSRKTSRKNTRNKSRFNRLSPLAGLLAAGLSVPALAAAQSVPFPTYVTGPQPNGSWVVSDGQVITPAGTQVDLGIRVRAKAIALNPNVRSHTAAVLTLGASEAVEVFDTSTGDVLQNYIAFGQDPSGSYSGIAYSADGKYLVFSQDSSNVTIAKVIEGRLAGRQRPGQRAAEQFLHHLLSEQPSGRLCQTLRHVLYSEHFLSRRRRALKGWQERLRPAEPERYAHQDRPDRDAADSRVRRSASATRRTAS